MLPERAISGQYASPRSKWGPLGTQYLVGDLGSHAQERPTFGLRHRLWPWPDSMSVRSGARPNRKFPLFLQPISVYLRGFTLKVKGL